MKRIILITMMFGLQVRAETLSNLVLQARADGYYSTTAIRDHLLARPVTGTNFATVVITNDAWTVWRAQTFDQVRAGAGLIAEDRATPTSAVAKLLAWANATPQTTRVQRTLAVSTALDYFLSVSGSDPIAPLIYTQIVKQLTYGTALWTNNGVLTGEMVESAH